MESSHSLEAFETTDLRALVEHGGHAQASEKLSVVYELFEREKYEFIAALEGDRVVGICSREQLGILLSHPFGRSLYLRQTLRERAMDPETRVRVDESLADALDRAFSREDREFFYDVLLVDEENRYIGMIPMPTLIRLQHKHFGAHIELLRAQQRELNEKNRQMNLELDMAWDMQRSFLPAPTNVNGKDPRLAYHYRFAPAEKLSGDFIQVLECDEDTLGILIGDVMGHGIRSALISAMIRALVERLEPWHNNPGELLTQINRDMAGVLRQEGTFFFLTACCLVADLRTGRVKYARAGHHNPLRIDRSGTVALMGEAQAITQPAIGLRPDAQYRTFEEPMRPGDFFLLYTDGLFEATNPNGEEFGQDRLHELIARHFPDKNTPDMLDTLIEHVRQFTGEPLFDDDVALAGVECRSA